MPPIGEVQLNQRAVWWPPAAAGTWEPGKAFVPALDDLGQVQLGTPQQVLVRWDYTAKQMLGPNGQPLSIDAQVTTADPIAPGGRMWLAPGQGPYDPDAVTQYARLVGGGGGGLPEIMEVVSYAHTIDVKGRTATRRLNLSVSKTTVAS